jgi:hypothetical protein
VGPLDHAQRVAALVAACDELKVTEVRGYERGALLQIDRRPPDAA